MKKKVKERLKTTFQFTKNLLTTGAFKETSRKLEIEICSKLPQEADQVIVEFGMGHGNITREILKNISPTSRLYSFEVNEKFCEYAAKNIKDTRLTIINDGAENLLKHVDAPVSGFVSSLPLTIFSKELRMKILKTARDAMSENGFYSQIQYSKVHFKTFKRVFATYSVKRIISFPLEYVYHCQKK